MMGFRFLNIAVNVILYTLTTITPEGHNCSGGPVIFIKLMGYLRQPKTVFYSTRLRNLFSGT